MLTQSFGTYYQVILWTQTWVLAFPLLLHKGMSCQPSGSVCILALSTETILRGGSDRSKGHFSHKARQALTFLSSQIDFPTPELGVTLDRPSRAEMLLFTLKLFALYQENNNFFPIWRRDFFLPPKRRHGPQEYTTLLRTMLETGGWHLSSSWTHILKPT